MAEENKPNSNTDNNPNEGNGTSNAVTREEMMAALQKARSDERSKLYATIEEQKKAREEELAERKKLEEQLKLLQESLSGKLDAPKPEPVQPDLTNPEVMMEMFKEQLAEMTSGFQAKFDAQAKELEEARKAQKETVKNIERKELEAFKAAKVREAGLTITAEFVSGKNKEEIEASVKALKEREDTVFKARDEQTMADIKAKFGKHLPGPMSPGSASGGGSTTGGRSYKDRVGALKDDKNRLRQSDVFNREVRQRATEALYSKK